MEPTPSAPTAAPARTCDVRTAHTADLGTAVLATVRRLLEDVFEGDFGDDDWDHTVGGVHVLAWEGTELVGHACVVQRRLLYAGRALRTGYVEAVGVRADRRRQGIGAALLTEAERIVRAAYEIGALGSSDEGAAFYAARGWLPWRGPLHACTPGGETVRTEEEEGCLYVLPVPPADELDLTAPLTADARPGDLW